MFSSTKFLKNMKTFLMNYINKYFIQECVLSNNIFSIMYSHTHYILFLFTLKNDESKLPIHPLLSLYKIINHYVQHPLLLSIEFSLYYYFANMYCTISHCALDQQSYLNPHELSICCI